MGPKSATAPSPARATATPTPTPRKPRTSKKAAVSAIQGSFDANGALALASTPALTTMRAGTGTGANIGRGRGRPRKTTTPALANTNTLRNELAPEHDESALKRIKTTESSGRLIEVQIPVSPDPARVRSDSDKENVGPGLGLSLKSKPASVQKVKGPTATALEKGKKRSAPRRSARKIKVENTEAYARCGEVVDCNGMCCGEPRCVYCFGEWEDSSQTLFS